MVVKLIKKHYFVRFLDNQTFLVFKNKSVFQIGNKKDSIVFGKIAKKNKKEDLIVYTNNRQFFNLFDAKGRKKLLSTKLPDYFLEFEVVKAVNELENLNMISMRVAAEQKILDVYDPVLRGIRYNLCKNSTQFLTQKSEFFQFSENSHFSSF